MKKGVRKTLLENVLYNTVKDIMGVEESKLEPTVPFRLLWENPMNE